MINIAHPPVSSKPPLNKFSTLRSVEKKGAGGRRTDVGRNAEQVDGECAPDVAARKFLRGAADSEGTKMSEKQTGDCDRNVIEPDSCSFEQLCDMIADLEKNGAENRSGGTIPLELETEAPALSQKYLGQDRPEKDISKDTCIPNGSTYEDIMSFLGTLEQDGPIPEFLGSNDRSRMCARTDVKITCQHPEALKEELATALLRLEDREATLSMLKTEMRNERKSACEKLERQRREHTADLHNQKTKYQTVVKRHQKFIEQLLTEKRDLTEKCNALAQRIKETEARQQRELRSALERHAVELQRAKEMCAASEKIRRERWLEAKTSKIKEMTVKGLEPELRSMVEQHQQEIQEIRSTHMKELQDVELRTIRRSNQQLEQLRLELTESHDKIVANEREALRVRFQEKFDEQESVLQTQQRKFYDELQQERKRFAEEQARRNEERDLAVKQSSIQFQERLDALAKQHNAEKRSLEESLGSEREAWIENYRRQQSSKFEAAQARIMDECNRERDRQIELAISRLEKETRDMRTNLQKSWENKLRCTREKYESELQNANERLESLEARLGTCQRRSEELERQLETTDKRLSRCAGELNESRQSVEKLTLERDQAKRIARQEIESEKRELEDKIASLYRELTQNNAERDSAMAQLYSRIKLIVTQKDLSIKNATREAIELRGKCDHLERLLDQQRKEFVLKSL